MLINDLENFTEIYLVLLGKLLANLDEFMKVSVYKNALVYWLI